MRAALLKSFGSLLGGFRRETGRSWWLWVLLALLDAAAQIVFRRNLEPGEFATLNSLLGLVGLMAVPLVALRQALACFYPQENQLARREILRQANLPLVQSAALGWGFFCALFFLPALDLLELPRFTQGLFALPNVVVVLAGCLCASLYEQQNKLRFWAGLLIVAGCARVLAGFVLAGAEPWAESGLAAGILAGLVLLTPILRPAKLAFGWDKAAVALRDREFRVYLGATLSVTLGIFLFTNADRIVAQVWFGRSTDNNLGLVRWGLFDGYQTAGLLGRALLWGTQPILLVLLARRARENNTGRELRRLCWLYLAVLIAGALLLPLLSLPLARLFGGPDEELTAYFIPRFALAMVPLGMLQGLGIFVLASRRYPECFTLGAGSLAYTLLLVLVGKPQLMQSYMLGGGTVVLLLVLFIGVVRWGRKQP
jgi:hypothetical protein